MVWLDQYDVGARIRPWASNWGRDSGEDILGKSFTNST